jgi:hypothetical protein
VTTEDDDPFRQILAELADGKRPAQNRSRELTGSWSKGRIG